MRKQTKEAKRRRARARRPAPWRSLVPYAIVGSLAVAAIAALFVVSAGGGSDQAEASTLRATRHPRSVTRRLP
jgi:hypothetical protein